MIQRHKLDAPEERELEGMSSAGDYDHSDLAALYPEIAKDDRPIIMSDDERHRLHDEDLQKQIAKIRNSFIWIGFQLVLPLLLVLAIAGVYISLADTPEVAMMLVTGLIFTGLITVGIWIAAYNAIRRRFSTHGLSGSTYIITTLGVLVLFALPVYSLASFTQDLWLTIAGMGAGLTAISIIATFLTLQFATKRASRRN